MKGSFGVFFFICDSRKSFAADSAGRGKSKRDAYLAEDALCHWVFNTESVFLEKKK
ncbi:MAG: hypothetical protein IJG56_01050 [Clostridia bacterium]|nr:hypothetical protein [Clostridia bacterium]